MIDLILEGLASLSIHFVSHSLTVPLDSPFEQLVHIRETEQYFTITSALFCFMIQAH